MSTREKIRAALARHREEQNRGVRPVPVKQPSLCQAAKPQRRIERFEPVLAACGHIIGFPLYADEDKFRRERRAKYRTKARCLSCILRQPAGCLAVQVLKACAICREKQQPFRLPDGASFAVTYDAGSEIWSGTLTVGPDVFQGSSRGLAQLTHELGEQWQARQQTETAAELD